MHWAVVIWLVDSAAEQVDLTVIFKPPFCFTSHLICKTAYLTSPKVFGAIILSLTWLPDISKNDKNYRIKLFKNHIHHKYFSPSAGCRRGLVCSTGQSLMKHENNFTTRRPVRLWYLSHIKRLVKLLHLSRSVRFRSPVQNKIGQVYNASIKPVNKFKQVYFFQTVNKHL